MALHRWREVLAAATVALIGLWWVWLGGLILVPLGLAVLALGAALGVLALRRLRFGKGGAAPGIVEVDEGQISYFGPQFGGFVSLRELAELRLLSKLGQRFWRLKQGDGQVLLIPVEAAGAERLFDALSSLPGMDSQALVAALDSPALGPGLVLHEDLGPVIWRKATTTRLRVV